MVMNWAQVHLWLNHLPILGVLFGLILLLAALWRKNEEWKKLSLIVFVIIGLLAAATYLTGEPAEEVVEHLPGVSKEDIESHEESALWSLIAIEALALASLAGLFLSRQSRIIPARFLTLCWLLAILAMGTVAWTAHLGGQIRHPETRPGFQAPTAAD